METCKHGSGAGFRKPAAAMRQGVECRAYVILSPSLGIFISNLDILIILFFLILLYEQQATEKESFNLNLF